MSTVSVRPGGTSEPSQTSLQPHQASAPSALLIANIVALLTLGVLVAILIIIWLTR